MSTLIPEPLRKQIDAEIREMITVRPHNAEAKVSAQLTSELLALIILTSHSADTCNKEFDNWTQNGPLASLEKEQRQKFAIGMLAAGRRDVINFLSGRMALEIDLESADITEATALQLVVMIMGNMVMQSLRLKHEQEQKGGAHGKTD